MDSERADEERGGDELSVQIDDRSDAGRPDRVAVPARVARARRHGLDAGVNHGADLVLLRGRSLRIEVCAVSAGGGGRPGRTGEIANENALKDLLVRVAQRRLAGLLDEDVVAVRVQREGSCRDAARSAGAIGSLTHALAAATWAAALVGSAVASEA